MKRTFKVNGMSCAACAASVQKAVGKISGVTEAAVNFAAESVTVNFDGRKAIAALSGMG